MKVYNMSRPLYLEIDAAGVGLGAELLQLRDGMNCGHDEVPDSVTLCLTVFARKSLLSAK